jgi:hypothetical protein
MSNVRIPDPFKRDCCVQLGLVLAIEEEVVLAVSLDVVYHQTAFLPSRSHASLAFDVLGARPGPGARLIRSAGLLTQ